MIKRIKYDPKNKKRWENLRKELSGKDNPKLWRHGSSDTGTILGVNPYQSKKEYFYHCVDFYDMEAHKSLPMYRGSIMEKPIFDEYWKYYNPEDPSNEAFLNNVYGERIKYRKGRLYNYTVLNDKYPYSFTNPDFQIYKNKYTPKGFLETKSVTYRSVEKYESGIPPYYIYQAYHQMMMLESDYVEVFMLVDDTEPKLYPFERNEVIIEQIIEAETEFGDLVMKGKEIVYDKSLSVSQKEYYIEEIAPEFDGSDALKSFYTELHKQKEHSVTVDGSLEQLVKVVEYLELKHEKIAPLNEDLKKRENEIRSWFCTDDIGEIQFDDYGKISYFKRINVPKRILTKHNEYGSEN